MDIELILDQIREAGLLEEGRFSFAANLSRDFKISTFPDNGDPFLIKFFQADNGNSDHAAVAAVATVLGEHVVAPIATFQTNSCTATVTPFLDNQPVQCTHLEQPKTLQQIAFILLSLTHAPAGEGFSAKAFAPSTIVNHFEQTGQIGVEGIEYLNNVFARLISTLPKTNQHCDFTFTNLGVDTNGTVIVFDWEDYGQVNFSGFDLATFLASHFHHGGLNAWISQSPGNLTEFLNENFDHLLWSGLGLSASDFTRLFPAYLLVFAFLKEKLGYGTIGARTLAFYSQINATEIWQDFLSHE